MEVSLSGQAVIGYWDPLRLDQVVTNLIGNAIKYWAGKDKEPEDEELEGQRSNGRRMGTSVTTSPDARL